MTQSPREIVRKALLFEKPERIPRQMWVLPWAEINFPEQLKQIHKRYPDDIVTAPDVYRKSPLVKGNQYGIGRYTDEWGCTFENLQNGIIGEVKDPLIKDARDAKLLKPPYEILPENYGQARGTVNSFCEQSDRFVIACCCPRPWERLQFLHGTVDSMMDIMTPDSGTKYLIDEIHRFYMKELEFWVATKVDAIMFMDDWGSQNSLLIPPGIWRSIFKPLYKDYCDIAHANNKFAFMHSDGCITEIYSDLIEVGVDAINSQLFCMDMQEIAEKAKGRITFWGEIDRQHILVADDSDEARKAVRKVAQHLYCPDGGIIAQFEFGPGARFENVEAILDEWEKVAG